MFDSSVCAPRLLNGHATLKVETLQLLFQMKHCLRMTNEHFGAAALVLCVVEAQIAHNRQTTVFRRTRPFVTDAPRFARQFLVTTQKTVVRRTIRKAGTTHFHILQQTQIFALMFNTCCIPIVGFFQIIWFQTTNVMRSTFTQLCHQFVTTGFDFEASSGGPFLLATSVLRLLGKERDDEGILRALHHFNDVGKQRVFVLVAKRHHVVHHVAGIVLHAKRTAVRAVVRIVAVRAANLFKKLVVGLGATLGVHRRTNIIEQQKDARWTFAFDQITHDLIVEERNRLPLNAFCLILVLFCFQRQFDKVLLQFLIHIVNAKLFKRIIFKDLKAINIQNSNQ
mmetsp:Transcript_5286/g.8737  ORF Transcript_5286/g.8737 Transcript_5286/m.8737 type:complete len:338 (-) Transcript_5286:259-1272(-)